MSAPIGMIIDFAGPQPPSGYLTCDGRLVSRITYAALFAVIGVYWGAGDGSTTFALPNLIGRSGVGPGTMIDQGGVSYGFTFTSALGFVGNQILQANLPNYNLVTDVQGLHAHSGATAPGGNHNHATDVQGQHGHNYITEWQDTDHIHTGYTDWQGVHNHSISNYGAFGGGGALGFQANTQPATFYTDNAGDHYHSVTTGGVSAGHRHGIDPDGAHGHNITYSGNLQLGIYADGSHQHNVALGGGGLAFEVLSPILVVTKIIFAGLQGATRVPAGAGTTIDGELVADEIAELREEIAQLRALLLPNAQRRLLQAPMRGTH